MTTEEKAKAYDDALERARKIRDQYKTYVPEYSYSDDIEDIFPELRESEDEQTRKRLIEFISDIKRISESGRNSWAVRKDDAEMCDAFLSYLEKHKEQKSTVWTEEDEEIREHLINIYNEWIDGGWSARPCGNDIKWLKNLLEGQKEQKPYGQRDECKDCQANYAGSCKGTCEMKRQEQKPADYDHEMWKNCEANFEGGKKEVIEHPEKYGLQKVQKPNYCHYGGDPNPERCRWCSAACSARLTEEQKSTEWNHDNKIQYDSVKSGIEAFASTYSFNIESKLFPQLTKEQQQLWREEIERAVIAGGEDGVELARDSRYKENRTVEWSNEDKSFYDSIMCEVVKEGMHPTPAQINWLKLLPERFALQPKQEWSEEDEVLRQDCIRFIETGWTDNGKSHLIPWLKSLPERFNLQSKQEWSKEDEKTVDAAIYWLKKVLSLKEVDDILTDDCPISIRKTVDRLKSLHLQPKQKLSKKDKKILLSLHHVMNCADAQNVVKRDGLSVEDVCNFLFSIEPYWKPSKEHVDAVKYFVNKHQSEAWSATGQWKEFTTLRELLGILQKLM